MLILAVLLVAVAAALLTAGAVAGMMPLVVAAIAVSLLAAVVLPVAVVRNRPWGRSEGAAAPTWSGAADEAGEGSPPDPA